MKSSHATQSTQSAMSSMQHVTTVCNVQGFIGIALLRHSSTPAKCWHRGEIMGLFRRYTAFEMCPSPCHP